MYEFLFENAYLIGLVGVLLSGMSLYGWIQTGSLAARNSALGLGLATLMLVSLNWIVVTEAEEVRSVVLKTAEELERNDTEAIKKRIHSHASVMVQNAVNFLPNVTFHQARVTRIHSVSVEDILGKRTARVKMNVIAQAETNRGSGKAARWVQVDFEKQGDSWLIVDYEERNPQHEFMKSRPY